MMAKPIRSLELHYRMIQFLIFIVTLLSLFGIYLCSDQFGSQDLVAYEITQIPWYSSFKGYETRQNPWTNREEKSLRHVVMVAKLPTLNKPWSFSSIVRQCKWLSRGIVEIQKFCFHGNVTSHFSLLLALTMCTSKIDNPWGRRVLTQKVCWIYLLRQYSLPLVCRSTFLNKNDHFPSCCVELLLPVREKKRSEILT